MKPIEEKSIFFDNEYKSDIYIQRNYNWIKSYLKFNNKIKIDTINTIDEHFNMSHIGCQILSMSKRIMNELMCLAEDNNIILYYQDTDSIHIEDDDIKNLEKIYNDKYGRELIGKSMGQFHSDFVMKGAKNIISTKLITLGKKSYCDVLEGYKLETKKYGIDEINNISLFNKNGDIYSIGDDLIDKYGDVQYKNNIELDENNNKIIIQDYHFRMKGIPQDILINRVKNSFLKNEKSYDNIYDLYQGLLSGDKITFNLLDNGSKNDRLQLKFNKDYSISVMDEFNRMISF